MENSIPDATPASVRIGATRLRPLADVMLLIVAFVSFSWGIWNARVGLGDDTGPVLLGLHAAETREYPRDLYLLCYTLLLRWVSPDPIGAAIVMRSAVSLFTTLALFYVLSSFRPHLHRAAVLTACAVWLASQLNAPLVQHENSSTFAFGISAVGLGWLLRRRSWTGFIGFAVAVSCAALDRPEYFAPALLIGAVSGVWLLRQTFKTRPSLFWSALAAGLVLVVIAILPIFQWRSFGRSQNQMSMDSYLLVGFGQCYAVFYNKEHPEVALEPWTEYREVFDEKFGRPTTFLGAIRNNPREAFRYFALNTLQNLRRIPGAMLKTRQKEGPESELIDRVPKLFLLTGLLIGGTLLARRIFVAGARPETNPLEGKRAPLSARTLGPVMADHAGRAVRHRVFSRDHHLHSAAAILDLVCTTGLLNCRRMLQFPAAAGIPEKTAMAVMDAGTHPFLPSAFSWPRAQPKFRGQCTTANRPEATGKSGPCRNVHPPISGLRLSRSRGLSKCRARPECGGHSEGELRRIACG